MTKDHFYSTASQFFEARRNFRKAFADYLSKLAHDYSAANGGALTFANWHDGELTLGIFNSSGSPELAPLDKDFVKSLQDPVVKALLLRQHHSVCTRNGRVEYTFTVDTES